MNRLLAATLMTAAVLAPGLSHALSCMAPNPGHEINWMQDRKAPVTVMTGRLTAVTSIPDITPEDPQGIATYRLDGSQITASGIEQDRSVTVTITGICAASWCAAMPREDTPQLYVLEGEGEALTATIGPCQGTVHGIPDAAQTKALQQCLTDGRCGEADILALEEMWN